MSYLFHPRAESNLPENARMAKKQEVQKKMKNIDVEVIDFFNLRNKYASAENAFYAYISKKRFDRSMEA